jgi:mannitol-1-phosphate 5-dehydrogenase
MVPIQDPTKLLVVRSEPYNELIVDREAFHHPLPSFADIHPVAPIEAYVDRKLFIHNMGHSTTAYLGFAIHPERETIAQVLEDGSIRDEVRRAMLQSRDVLLALHPSVFSKKELDAHIGDLLTRFSNHALGDTVHRVGRDLERKLRYDDRLLGIIIEAERLGKDWDAIGRAYLKALSFTAKDSGGSTYPPDLAFLKTLARFDWPEKLCKASSWEEGDLSKSLCLSISEKLQILE